MCNMISWLTKIHVKKSGRKQNIKVPKNIDAALSLALKKVNLPKEMKICFSWLIDNGSKTLNACALFPGKIILNSEWVAHLVLLGKDETINAFQATIGHELTHKDKDYLFIEFFTKDKKFINWVNEVHADFGASEKCFQNVREKVFSAVIYKRKYKGERDKDSSAHPSWKRREEYILNYDFNENLICKIAEDVDCKNLKLINNVSKHFTEIILH